MQEVTDEAMKNTVLKAVKKEWLCSGAIPKNFDKGGSKCDVKKQNGCGPCAATPKFLKMET